MGCVWVSPLLRKRFASSFGLAVGKGGREGESSPSCSPYRDTGDSPVELDLDDDVELGISATTSC